MIRRCFQRITKMFQAKSSPLQTKYQQQTKKDTNAIDNYLKIFLILFTLTEAVRSTVSEVLLKGPSAWFEVFLRVAFSVFISIVFLARLLFKQKNSAFYPRIGKIAMFLFVVIYCVLNTFLLFKRVDSYYRIS